MILIAKDALFEPEKFFYENLLRPSFTYDDTLLNLFLDVFWPKFAEFFFFENRAPSHSRVYSHAPLCQKSENLNEPISRKVIGDTLIKKIEFGLRSYKKHV